VYADQYDGVEDNGKVMVETHLCLEMKWLLSGAMHFFGGREAVLGFETSCLLGKHATM
jgi:hypothetical protein